MHRHTIHVVEQGRRRDACRERVHSRMQRPARPPCFSFRCLSCHVVFLFLMRLRYPDSVIPLFAEKACIWQFRALDIHPPLSRIWAPLPTQIELRFIFLLQLPPPLPHHVGLDSLMHACTRPAMWSDLLRTEHPHSAASVTVTAQPNALTDLPVSTTAACRLRNLASHLPGAHRPRVQPPSPPGAANHAPRDEGEQGSLTTRDGLIT